MTLDMPTEPKDEIDWAVEQIRKVRRGTLTDVAPYTPDQWEECMRNRIAAYVRILEKHGSTYRMPSDLER